MNIELHEGGMCVLFRINEDRTIDLADISSVPEPSPLSVLMDDAGHTKARQFLAVQVTGESSTDFHADKHDAGSVSREWRYIDHSIEKNKQGHLLILQAEAGNGLRCAYHMQFYNGLPVVRTWSTLTNAGKEPIGLDYVSSFMYQGIGKDRSSSAYDHVEFYVPRNGWCNEARWQQMTAAEAGLSHLPTLGYNCADKGNSRFHYGCRNSWSTAEYLPMGLCRDPECGQTYFFQIEHSGAWTAEYGTADGRQLYLCLLGPDEESDWWVELQPGESFTTVSAAFGAVQGGVDEAIATLTDYRRRIRRQNSDDERLNVVFNDYMNCLFGDPTEEKEIPIIDTAAALGCEYYCMDAGWYDKGYWWDRIGEWKESPERFPNGLKAVFDHAREKGLKMGLWLEIEAMGVACEYAQNVPDDWFVCNHGKRRVENKRWLLDFRNPDVRAYCTGVVDRLIQDYGCTYFKIDYNVTTGVGSDLNAMSRGDAMLNHVRALYSWIQELYARHPELVVEACSSGAQRMDYGILSLHSLQSTSDQMDYVNNAFIAAAVASAVTPEQAGMWVYPYQDDREHVIFNIVNGLLLRPYISGRVWDLSENNLELIREGIETYKRIRGNIRHMLPFFPLGLSKVGDQNLAYGLIDEKRAYLSVWTVGTNRATIPLGKIGRKVSYVKVIYPSSGDCQYDVWNDVLTIDMPCKICARTFEIELGDQQ